MAYASQESRIYGFTEVCSIAADKRIMTQDERWLLKYNEVKMFIEREHRNPSKHRVEEHDMVNFLKHTRKQLNAGLLKAERIEEFRKLQVLIEQYKRKNQYE